jgi:hypothetical protein
MEIQHWLKSPGEPVVRLFELTGDQTGPPITVDVEIGGYGPVIILPLKQPEDPHGTAQVAVDYFNGGLQALVYDSPCDEQAVAVRYNQDGTIAEIAVRRDLMDRVINNDRVSAWQEARDKDKAA